MNAVFIHIPRTAGRFIMASLGLEKFIYPRRVIRLFEQKGKVTFGHQDYIFLLRKGWVNEEFHKTSFKFTFCRHPLERLVSHYHHAKKNHPEIPLEGVSFRNFVMNLDWFGQLRRGKKSIFRPQSNCVRKVDLDFIGKYETLYDDIKKVADIIGVKVINSRPIGRTDHLPYMGYYDEVLKEKAIKFYRKDFERFGYDY